MKIWVLLAFVVVLLLMGTREGFASGDPPICPTGSTLNDAGLCAFSDVPTRSPTSCPGGYTYKDSVCKKEPVPPTCPSGFTLTTDKPPKCTTSVAGTGTLTQTSTSAMDTTTGGSTTQLQPNSGTAGRGKGLFGPAFTELGGGGDGRDMTDTSKTTKYPELLGGGVEPSTRIEGVGIVGPSKSWQLTQSGDLPSACSLGTEERSAFFPFSRCPGDKDLIPDPYRVSQTYSAASYGSKTEPVPFLTDFSAFLK